MGGGDGRAKIEGRPARETRGHQEQAGRPLFDQCALEVGDITTRLRACDDRSRPGQPNRGEDGVAIVDDVPGGDNHPVGHVGRIRQRRDALGRIAGHRRRHRHRDRGGSAVHDRSRLGAVMAGYAGADRRLQLVDDKMLRQGVSDCGPHAGR